MMLLADRIGCMLPPIVSQDWMLENIDDVAVCDVRYYLDGRSGADAYVDGHLPGAVFIDMDTVLASAAGPVVGRHPLPSPETFAKGLAAAGIADNHPVVAYDDLGGMAAGRLVWMLRVIGQPAALLSGGLQGWSGALDRGGPLVQSVERSEVAWPEDALASADQVAAHVQGGGVVVDSRAPARFRGESEPVDKQAGHVPGAINLPFVENLAAPGMDGGEFLAIEDLRSRFSDAHVDQDTIFYCGSGVSACHNVLAVEAVGLGRPRLYVGSWSGWSSDPGRPVATGA